MSEAPARIWVQPDIKGYCITGVWPWQPSDRRNVREYILASEADREKAEAVAAERWRIIAAVNNSIIHSELLDEIAAAFRA